MPDSIRDLRDGRFAWFSASFLDLQLSWKAKLTYMGLISFADGRTQSCFPSKAKLATILGVGKTTVYQGLKELEAAGVIEVVSSQDSQDAAQSSNEYRLLAFRNTEPPIRNTHPPHSQCEPTPVRITNPNNNQKEQEEDTSLFPLVRNTENPPEAATPSKESLKPKERAELGIRNVLFPLYQEACERSDTYTLTPARLKKGVERFLECVDRARGDWESAGRMFAAAVGALSNSDFHMGRDPKTAGKRYCDWIDNLCKSPEQFEKWLVKAEEGR